MFLNAFNSYDIPYKLELRHPATGEPILDKDGVAAFISIYSPKSLTYEKFRKQKWNESKREAKKNKRPEPTYEEAVSTGAEYFAALTAGWYLVNPNTREGDDTFDFAKAVEMYSDRRAQWIVSQIEAALEDDANFLIPSA